MNSFQANSSKASPESFCQKQSDVSATASALVIAAADKAGMDNIDRSKIDAIIMRESGDTAYMKQQIKRDEQVNRRIDKMLLQLQEKEAVGLGDDWKRQIEQSMESDIHKLRQCRATRSSKVVVDMDMFYMACELLSRPGLDSKPCCVGHGMLLTSNYTARKYGVRSAMAGWIADKLVEEISGGKEKLIHISSNFDLYQQKSDIVRKVMLQFDPHMKSYSLDEVYLDIGPYVALYMEGKAHDDIVNILQHDSNNNSNNSNITSCGNTTSSSTSTAQSADNVHHDSAQQHTLPDASETMLHPLVRFPQHQALQAATEVVQDMRHRVQVATGGLTCSAGLAPNFMLAKIASDRHKPNGQCIISPEQVLPFVHPLPARKIPGIGRVTEKMLRALDITTVKQLFEQRAIIHYLFKPATRKFLLLASMGISGHEDHTDADDETDEEHEIQRKGISKERTFTAGKSWTEVMMKLEEIARMLSNTMKEKKLYSQTVTLKVKLHTFDVISRCRTLPRGAFIQGPDDLLSLSAELLRELKREHKGVHRGSSFSIRLLGIRCSNFVGEKERSALDGMNIQNYFAKSPIKSPKNTKAKSSPSTSSSSPSKKRTSGSAHMPCATSPVCPFFNPAQLSSASTMQPKRVLNQESQELAGPAVLAATASTASTIHSSSNDHLVSESNVANFSSDCIQCPVCQKSMKGQSNAQLNQHIDACLNKATNQKTICDNERDDWNITQTPDSSPTKRRRLTDFFAKATSSRNEN